VYRTKSRKTKPTICTNFWNLFLELNSTCFGQFLCPSSGGFHCTYSNGICHTIFLLASCQQTCTRHIPLLCVQWKTPDDGQRNCPKHVEFHSKNKFQKLVHLVRFIIRKLQVLLQPLPTNVEALNAVSHSVLSLIYKTIYICCPIIPLNYNKK
jgi:hypothetical protein